ncbi:dTMP kinase [Candidatus Marinimicrobia bacterium]|nr:dTMP kinase [Candidatus Neomarinimicrobiota bacterium]
MSTSTKNIFISFEGIDGCGKSTQVDLLIKKLNSLKIRSLLVREPGGSKIAENIRSILLDNSNRLMSNETEALLMTASRAQLTREVIIPKLNEGFVVVADRFQDSTIAYQGGGRGLDISFLEMLNLFATNHLIPNMTFYIDISAKEGLKRTISNEFDRIENAGEAFQVRVRNEYLKLIKKEPQRVFLVDGTKTVTEIHEEIWSKIEKII